jgi:hypothetical protein
MTLNINYAKNKGWNTVTPAPSFTTIGTVGSVGQMAAGHVLAQGSFPSAAYVNTSFYNLTNTSTVSDGNTSLAHNLTNNGTAPFTGTGILGLSNSCLSINGSSQWLSSIDPFFDPGDNDFTVGGWYKPTSWVSGIQAFFTNWVQSGDWSYYIGINYLKPGALRVYCTTLGTDVTLIIDYDVSNFIGWHHVVLKYVASLNTFYLYLDGKRVISGMTPGNLRPIGANRNFNLGASNSGTMHQFNGLIDEFFFCNGTAFTDNDIARIYASKYNHNLNISPLQQKWIMQGTNSGHTRELQDKIIDIQTNDLYFDLSGESPTTQVSLRLANMY